MNDDFSRNQEAYIDNAAYRAANTVGERVERALKETIGQLKETMACTASNLGTVREAVASESREHADKLITTHAADCPAGTIARNWKLILAGFTLGGVVTGASGAAVIGHLLKLFQ